MCLFFEKAASGCLVCLSLSSRMRVIVLKPMPQSLQLQIFGLNKQRRSSCAHLSRPIFYRRVDKRFSPRALLGIITRLDNHEITGRNPRLVVYIQISSDARPGWERPQRNPTHIFIQDNRQQPAVNDSRPACNAVSEEYHVYS